jgi:hypothetical protein
MRRRALATAAIVLAPVVTALLAGPGCDPVEGASRSRAPVNACPEHACEAYPAGRTQAKCSVEGRCESAGLPDSFVIVVSVPDTSFLAPGYTFLVPSNDLLHAKPPFRPGCTPPTCLPLPSLGEATGGYVVRADAATAMGIRIDDGASIPVRVTFAPFVPQSSPAAEAIATGLPTDLSFAASRLFQEDVIRYEQPLPAGPYLRMSYPEPPFDEMFPPILDPVTIPTGTLTDEFTLTSKQLDDVTGLTRTARVRRARGLDGFRVWIEETRTHRRVSVARTLRGAVAEARLDTVGQNADGTTALRDGLSVVVAPPDSWIGVPRFESQLIGGQGLGDIAYPEIPPPATVVGVIGAHDPARPDGELSGIPSRVTLESTTLRLADGTSEQLLRYETSLSTDASGRFSTVVPPGTYDVVIEPAIGTGFSKSKRTVELPQASLVLEPSRRSAAVGRAMLSDGRPLASATILAMPAGASGASGVAPRGGRTVTGEDGSFRLELDLGSYAIAVVPEEGTGFPRIVTVRPVNAAPEEDLGDLVVPPPVKLAFTIKGFSVKDPGRALSIANAFVRIFGLPDAKAGASAGGEALFEIGRGVTDDTGKCEILLAQQPR